MLSKILNIAWKDLYLTYTDRNLLLIMIATPLALSTIISLAFGGFFTNSGNDVPINDIPVAVVNLDQTVDGVNQGQVFIEALVPEGDPDPDNVLHQLTEAVALDDADAARAGVDTGEYAAAIIVPPDFTESLSISQDKQTITPTSVEVYASSASPVSASIVRGITQNFVNQIATGSITVAAVIDELVARIPENPAFGLAFAAQGEALSDYFTQAFSFQEMPITIEQQTVTGASALSINPLVLFGSAQAVFFMLFTAMGSANSILEERRDGTLQRMVVSPTPRMTILLGKMVGTFFNCVVQVVLLFVALTLIGSLVSGQFQIIWGTNILLIALVIVAVAFSAAGLGTLVASLVKTAEQGNVIGSVISLAMGAFGGVFFSVDQIPALAPISRLTLVWWGTNAFTKLSLEQTDVGLNLLVLVVLGVITFGIGVFAFSRRLSV